MSNEMVIANLVQALRYYANEENWDTCEATGWDMLRGPIEGGYMLHAATVAQRALAQAGVT